MEWLKKLMEKHGVGAELITVIMEEAGNTKYIPKERFDEVNNSLKELKEQLTDRDKQLKTIGEKVKGNEELEKQITNLQEENKKASETYEAKIRNITLDNALKMKLKDGNAKYEDLLMTKFDREKLVIKEDGNIEGLEEQFNALKEGYKDLFEQPLKGSAPSNTGGSASGNTLQHEYDAAIKSGNMPLAISIKNKMYEQ